MAEEKMNKSTFATLRAINVKEHVEKKNRLDYLSWAYAWDYVMNNYPDSNYEVHENRDGWNYFSDGRTCWVKVSVTIQGVARTMTLPVMDNHNFSIPFEKVTSFDVNKAIMRCLTKCIALHGLGLAVYAGEDLPDETTDDAPKTGKNAPRTNGNDKVGKNTNDTTKTPQSEKLTANEPKQDRAKLLIGLMNEAGIPNSVVIEYMKAHHDGKKVAELNDEDFGKLMNYVGDIAKKWEKQRAERLGEEHGYEECNE